MNGELVGRVIFGHINGKFEKMSEAEMSLFVDELKQLMQRYFVVKIDVCYSPDIEEQ